MRLTYHLLVLTFMVGACSSSEATDGGPPDSCPACEGLRFPDGQTEGGILDGGADSSVDPLDWDGDGLLNDVEKQLGLDPNNKDTDNDGVDDGQEVGNPSSPTDSDSDGKIDAKEPNDFDSDLDGIVDSQDTDDTDGPCGAVQRLFILATLSQSTTLSKACSPYKVLGSLTVNAGATLTVGPDVTVQFGPAATLFVGDTNTTGELKLAGSKNSSGSISPVLLTADSLQPKKSFWRGVVVQNGTLVDLSYATLEFGGGPTGGADPRALLLIKQASGISLTNSNLQHGNGHGLHATLTNTVSSLFSTFGGNSFVDLDHAAALNIRHLGEIGNSNSFGTEGSGGEVDVSEGTVNQMATWQGLGVPYVFEEASIYVNAPLTLQAGVKLQLPTDAAVYVGYSTGGKLAATGTSAAPVIFTGTATTGGSWQGIMLYNGNHSLQHVRVIGAGKTSSIPLDTALYVDVYSSLSVKDLVVTNSSGYGVYYYRSSSECSTLSTAEIGFGGGITSCGVFCVDDINSPGVCLKQAL